MMGNGCWKLLSMASVRSMHSCMTCTSVTMSKLKMSSVMFPLRGRKCFRNRLISVSHRLWERGFHTYTASKSPLSLRMRFCMFFVIPILKILSILLIRSESALLFEAESEPESEPEPESESESESEPELESESAFLSEVAGVFRVYEIVDLAFAM